MATLLEEQIHDLLQQIVVRACGHQRPDLVTEFAAVLMTLLKREGYQ